MDARFGLWRKLSAKELMLLICGVGEDSRESPLDCKEIQPVHPKGDQSWVFIAWTDAEAETPNILATWCKELTHWKRPWCWEGLGAGGEGDDRGWDGWMASPTRWTWVWVNSGSWGWTGRPGMLRFIGPQRVGHDWVTELNWTDCVGFSHTSTYISHKYTYVPSPKVEFVTCLAKWPLVHTIIWDII